MIQLDLCWHGPKWLVTENKTTGLTEREEDTENSECYATNTYTSISVMIDAEKYGNYIRLLRVIAWFLRYIQIVRKKWIISDLSFEKLKNAETAIIKLEQRKVREHIILNKSNKTKTTSMFLCGMEV